MTVQPNSLAILATAPFEGLDLPTIEWRGQPVWRAADVATALGYAHSLGISQAVRKEWRDEVTEGEDFIKIEGEDLRPFKVAGLAEPNANALLLLTESGVNLVAILSRQPAARRLRRWLATEVLPAIRRTGAYSAAPSRPTDVRAVCSLARQLRLSGDKAGSIAMLREAAGLPPLEASTVLSGASPRTFVSHLAGRVAAVVGDRKETTVHEVIGLLKADGTHSNETLVGTALRRLGWTRHRRTAPPRLHFYRRPVRS